MSTPLLEHAAARELSILPVRPVRIALAGCGVVGGELVRLLHHTRETVALRYGIGFEVVRVLVRDHHRPRPGELAEGVLTTDVDAFLAADADVVVEAIGGLDPALRIARATLEAGRRLVTANKALIAAHGPELMRLARRRRTRLDFESAVGGGIPVLRAIRDQVALTEVVELRGILNGTVNHILTRLGEGASYAAALREAQERGFAEADPSRDVSGQDSADKLRVLAWLVHGVHPRRLPLRRRGIVPHPERLAEDAAALGGVVRLVAEVRAEEGGVWGTVEPVVVAPDSPLGQVRGEENLVLVRSRWNGVLRLAGPGAGGGPTASALLGDLVRGARPQRVAAPRVAGGEPDAVSARWVLSVARAPGAERTLRDALGRARIEAEGVDAGGSGVRARIAEAPWSRVVLAGRALQAAGARPVAARVEG